MSSSSPENFLSNCCHNIKSDKILTLTLKPLLQKFFKAEIPPIKTLKFKNIYTFPPPIFVNYDEFNTIFCNQKMKWPNLNSPVFLLVYFFFRDNKFLLHSNWCTTQSYLPMMRIEQYLTFDRQTWLALLQKRNKMGDPPV